MIAQLVALSDVCVTNSQLSEAKHCRWFEPSSGSQRKADRQQAVFFSYLKIMNSYLKLNFCENALKKRGKYIIIITIYVLT